MLEDVLVRQGIAYQVIGGPRFYERAEVKDLISYLQVIDNPFDSVSLLRIANKPRRGIGDTTLQRLQAFANAREISFWEALEYPEEAGVATASARAVDNLRLLLALQVGVADPVPQIVEAVLERSVTSRRSRTSGRSRREGASRTCRSFSASRTSTRRRPRSRVSPRSCRRSLSTPTRTRCAARRAWSR